MKNLKYLFLFFSFLLIFSSIFSQDGVQTAKSAKTIFPEEKVVLSYSEETIEFKKERGSNNLIAIQNIEQNFVSLKSQQQAGRAIFYDDYSEVTKTSGSPSPKIKDTYYQSNDIFHSDARVKYATFSLRQFGSTATLEATKKYNDLKYLTKTFLPEIYTCLRREITFIVPDVFDVELLEINFEGYGIEKSVSKNKGKTYYKYILRNVEKFSKKGGLPGSSHIYPHILVQTKSFNDGKIKKTIFPTTNELYAWYRQLVMGVKNDSEKLKSLAEELIQNAESDEEKIENIFYWVQNNIRYIAFEDGIAGYQPEDCQTVLHNRYGDCKGMANLTKELLKLAGFDARLAWLGTRTLAYNYTIPSLATDNHMICALKKGEDFLFLDATEKFMNVGDLAERIQGQNVLIEDGDAFILKHIPVKDLNQNLKKIDLNLTLNEKSELVGEVEFELRGEARTEIMYYVNHTPGKKREDLFKMVLKGGEPLNSVTDLEIEGDGSNDNILKIKGLLTIPNKISSFDEEYYLYLNPFQYYSNYDFSEDRKFDYWFDYKQNETVNIQFNLPTEYEIQTIPENYQKENKEYSLKINYQKEANNLNYHWKMQIPTAVISQRNQKQWNQMIKDLNENYNQPIILKKKS